MKIQSMIPSTYLKQSDFDENGYIVTVSHFKQENVAPDDKPAENKWVVYFAEYPDKGMVLNTTNINGMSAACGTEETDDWKGKEVIVYVDPTVGYAGKITGGLRVRKHAVAAAPTRRQSPAPAGKADDMADSTPF